MFEQHRCTTPQFIQYNTFPWQSGKVFAGTNKNKQYNKTTIQHALTTAVVVHWAYPKDKTK